MTPALSASGCRLLLQAASSRTPTRSLALLGPVWSVAAAPALPTGLPESRPASTRAAAASSESADISYAARKAAAKEQRRQTYLRRQERRDALQNRRSRVNGEGQGGKKAAFREWFDRYRARQETMERKARQADLPWKVRVAAVVERLPVVLPDMPQWEEDFEELRGYLEGFGREYPKELNFTRELEEGEKHNMTLEELLAELPDGYKPAPRETEADEKGEVRTLERKLKERVFLSIQPREGGGRWGPFPSTDAREGETLLDAAKRATSDAVGTKLELYCPSNCPVAVEMNAFKEKRGHFGVKTFYFRVQLDDGDVDPKAMKAEDYAWLTREEVKDRMKDQYGELSSKLYHHLL